MGGKYLAWLLSCTRSSEGRSAWRPGGDIVCKSWDNVQNHQYTLAASTFMNKDLSTSTLKGDILNLQHQALASARLT